jgi:hypothetical protein
LPNIPGKLMLSGRRSWTSSIKIFHLISGPVFRSSEIPTAPYDISGHIRHLSEKPLFGQWIQPHPHPQADFAGTTGTPSGLPVTVMVYGDARDRMRARCQAHARRARTMKAGRFLWIFAVAVLIVFSSVAQAQDNKPTPEYSLGADRIARMEQIIDSFANAKRFMGDVLVAEDGRAVLDKSYGFANVEWQVPNTAESRFRLGSITKQFTATSILLLEQQGMSSRTSSTSTRTRSSSTQGSWTCPTSTSSIGRRWHPSWSIRLA